MGDEAAITGVEAETPNTVLTGDAVADEVSLENSDVTAAEAATAEDAGTTDVGDAGDAGEASGQVPPDTYADFVMPEGIELDEAVLSEATPIFKELGLTQEQAQKLVEFHAQQVQAGSQKQVDNFNQLMSEWRTSAQNDSEFGGDKFNENVKIAQSAVAAYGTPELKQLLDDHGVGNHPEVIRFMVRVGHTLKEDVPGSSGAVTPPAGDRVSILYPKES